MMAALLTSLGISIHAPREGGDVRPSPPTPNCVLFQSTPPARGATGGRSAAQPALADFNPRPPRGGRLDCIHSTPETITISIHAPREGGDGQLSRFSSQSILISIHAPREGGDYQNHPHQANDNIFQSTPPARGATLFLRLTLSLGIFQSTPPARGATSTGNPPNDSPKISIHAPREGGDPKSPPSGQ